jgi:hypothetical protein
MTTTEQKAPVEIFISYARADEREKSDLTDHLAVLRYAGVSVWHDRDINAGSDWAKEISEHLDRAKIILLLVSASFLDSDYCWSIEMERALARQASGAARVIPVILKPCSWRDAPIGKLEPLPRGGKPIASSPNRDAAYLEVVNGIRGVLGVPSPKAARR